MVSRPSPEFINLVLGVLLDDVVDRLVPVVLLHLVDRVVADREVDVDRLGGVASQTADARYGSDYLDGHGGPGEKVMRGGAKIEMRERGELTVEAGQGGRGHRRVLADAQPRCAGLRGRSARSR